MPRSKSYDREIVLWRATETFWKKGYEATSISDLESATGINRYGLYSSFGGKKSLFLACLETYRREVIERQTASLVSPGGAAGVRMFFDSFTKAPKAARERGCLVVNSLAELSGIDRDIDAAVKSHTRFILRRLRHAVETARRDDEIVARQHPEEISSCLLALLQGILIMSKSSFSRPLATSAIDTALDGLIL